MQELNKVKSEPLDIFITHKNCNDGTGSALSVLFYCYENNLKLPEIIFLEHGDDAPDVTNQNVLMADFSFNKNTMLKLHDEAKHFICLDHHKTAYEDLHDLDFCIFDMEHSGAYLTWTYLNHEVQVPELILYIEDKDLWNWKLYDSKIINAGIDRLDFFKLKESFYCTNDLREFLFGNSFLNESYDKGKIILEEKEKQVSRIISSINDNSMTNLNGYIMPCINNKDNISEVGNAISNIYNMSCQYFITDDAIVFSLRSVGYHDVGSLAQEFGGGGHLNSAAFRYPLDIFITNDGFQQLLLHKELKPL